LAGAFRVAALEHELRHAILGPLMETQARRALTASGDDFGVFFGRPLTVVLLLVALLAFVLPHLPALRGRAFSDED
jgi:putative tricarboxylic transport membrane protein